jgi:tRNA pseudouridine38-40 synthase
VRVVARGASLFIEFEAEGFLYKMVRLMAGSLVETGLAKASTDDIQYRLDHPKAAFSQARNVAPAAGLILVRVRY